MTTLKELKASAAETRETLCTTSVPRVLHTPKLSWESGKRKLVLKRAHEISTRVVLKDMWESPRFLAIRLEIMFDEHQTLHITTNTPGLVMAASCCRDAFQQQALDGLLW